MRIFNKCPALFRPDSHDIFIVAKDVIERKRVIHILKKYQYKNWLSDFSKINGIK